MEMQIRSSEYSWRWGWLMGSCVPRTHFIVIRKIDEWNKIERDFDLSNFSSLVSFPWFIETRLDSFVLVLFSTWNRPGLLQNYSSSIETLVNLTTHLLDSRKQVYLKRITLIFDKYYYLLPNALHDFLAFQWLGPGLFTCLFDNLQGIAWLSVRLFSIHKLVFNFKGNFVWKCKHNVNRPCCSFLTWTRTVTVLFFHPYFAANRIDSLYYWNVQNFRSFMSSALGSTNSNCESVICNYTRQHTNKHRHICWSLNLRKFNLCFKFSLSLRRLGDRSKTFSYYYYLSHGTLCSCKFPNYIYCKRR